MFKNLTDFTYKRSASEAFGFYLAYLFLGLIIAFMIGALISVAGFDNIDEVRVGAVFAVLFTIFLSVVMLYKKEGFNSFGHIVLAVLAAILSVFGGFILGLIPLAYLTTR